MDGGREKMSGVRDSAVASQPCPSGHITADKREIKDFPKSRQGGTSFIRKTLYAILLQDDIGRWLKCFWTYLRI